METVENEIKKLCHMVMQVIEFSVSKFLPLKCLCLGSYHSSLYVYVPKVEISMFRFLPLKSHCLGS